MATQPATVLTIGNTGITIPDVLHNVRLHPCSKVFVVLRIPTLNAGTHTFATSDDGGSTWTTALGSLALTGYEPTNPTAATSTGGQRLVFGPYAPGVKVRLTSSVAQTATVPVYFLF